MSQLFLLCTIRLGQSVGFRWTSALNRDFANQLSFEHWPIRSAAWVGDFDPETISYKSVNKANIQHGLDVIEKIVERYSGHPAVLGLEPVNEPCAYASLVWVTEFSLLIRGAYAY